MADSSKAFRRILAPLALGLSLFSGSAFAITLFQPITLFEDDDLDYFLYDADSNGLLDVGDRLATVFEVNQTSGIFLGQGPVQIGPNEELTGIAALEVRSLEDPENDGLFDFYFGPISVGLNTLLSADVVQGAAGEGAIVAMYLDQSPDLNVINGSCGTLAQCIAAATDGTVFEVDGFSGDAADLWFAGDVSPSPASLLTVAAATKVGVVNFNLETFQAAVPLTDTRLIGSGDLLGGQGLDSTLLSNGGAGSTNPVFARSDFDLQKNIPEPVPLALLGIGLLGLGARSAARRRAV